MPGPFGYIHDRNCCCTYFIPCCGDRCEPLYIGDDLLEHPGECPNPLPLTLTIDFTGTPTIGSYACFTGSGTLTFKTPLSGGTFCWEGDFSGSCTDCHGNPMTWAFRVTLCCQEEVGHVISMVPLSGTACPADTLTAELSLIECDPFLVEGCWPTFGACMVCFGDSPSFDVCFQIYETP